MRLLMYDCYLKSKIRNQKFNLYFWIMKLYGLIGYPLGHSFSKKYFTEKFQTEKLDCRFENFPIEHIGLLPEILKDNPGLLGLCVTIPYKEKVIPYLDELSDEVVHIKACNSIQIRNGKLTGYNTDTTGFEKSLQTKLKDHHTSALILGTGGASKAVAYVLQKKNISFRKVSRTGGDGALTYDSLSAADIAGHTLIINASPLGTYPNENTFPDIPYEALTPRHLLFDLVYNPPKTIFLQKGEEKGAAILNGYEMLVEQAEASWRIWNR